MSHSLTRWSQLVALTVGVGLWSACAHQPSVDPQIAVSTAAVDAARTEGAAALAPEPFTAALTKLDQARQAAQAGQTETALRMAEQAQADAQVARSQATAEKARRAAATMDASLQDLRRETRTGATAAP